MFCDPLSVGGLDFGHDDDFVFNFALDGLGIIEFAAMEKRNGDNLSLREPRELCLCPLGDLGKLQFASNIRGMHLSAELREELPDVMAKSLKATPSNGQVFADTDGAASGSPDAGFRTIFAGILFSRRFIVSYQAVLLVLLLLFTIRYWMSRLRARVRQRRLLAPSSTLREEFPSLGHESGSSSSSSTIIGDSPSPKNGTIDEDLERTPLLKSEYHAAEFRRLGYPVRAFLLYQPSPLPILNKALPSNGTTLAILIFIGIQVFYLFYRMPLSIPMLFVFADRASLLFVANLPLLYLFAAKNQPIKLLTGYSYESLNIVHRRLGEVMCLLALLHSAGMIGVWYTILRPTGFSLAKFLLSKIILLGIGAFVAYELIYFTSLGSFRQRWYELFLALHVSLQVIALVLLWFHHHNSKPYVGVALAIFLIDRLVYRMTFKTHSARASLTVCKDGQTVIVCTESIFTLKGQYLGYLVGAGLTKGWKATEHVFLTVPALSQAHFIQAHPFTIASVAPDPDASSGELKLIIRAQDGFSKDLLKYARSHDAVKVRLDGPYGSQNALHLLQQCDLSVVVAGGSGIAVALPLLWAVQSSRKACDLEWRPTGRGSSSVVLIWVIRHAGHAAWAGSQIESLRDCGVEVIMPPPTAENGHPDVPSIVTSWISAHDDKLFSGKAKTGVVCSGPDGMNRSVRNTCSSLLAHGRDVDIEVEKFGW
ncbi:MAG: hypothetical protein LQ345_007419 [Seirophora villosa]|nr:MAG: hypothetical protein LQ345_007419 [Seirophora villosa]